jgi:hypothetical protein
MKNRRLPARGVGVVARGSRLRGGRGVAHHLALCHDDPAHVESLAITLLDHQNDDVAAAAATSLGHLARLHGSLTDERLARLRLGVAADRPSIRGRALDALDDVAMFARHDS